MKKLVNNCVLFAALALSVTTVCFADSESDIRYRRDHCNKVCEHEIRMREDRPACYAQCENTMKKELKTATKEIVPQYVERPGDCPITPKKNVEAILGIKVQKVITDGNRWMTCEFVSENIVVRIIDSVGAPIISARNLQTGGSENIDDALLSKLSEVASRQIEIWENYQKKHPKTIGI